jgi:hypothetical protein
MVRLKWRDGPRKWETPIEGQAAMIHKDDAVRIMREVRDFYATGMKSNNKVYVTGVPADRYIGYDDPFDGKFQKWSTTMMAEKAGRRNEGAFLSGQYRPSNPDVNRPIGPAGGESFYDFGKRIYDGGKRSQFASGNCMEMAAVSAVIAIDDYHFAPDWLYMGVVNPPGDHAFCLLSMRKPRWGTPTDMVSGSSNGAAYIIDPWLNTVCPADDYWTAVQLRVAKWAADGKRIAWGGLDGNHLGWYSPGGAYAAAFATSSLSFIPMTQKL